MSGDDMLTAALSGDVRSARRLAESPWTEVQATAEKGGPLVLSASAVAMVLADLRTHSISEADARDWAHFVQRGYFAGGSGPLMPLDIKYEGAREDAIADAVARLTELRDEEDGSIDQEESQVLEARLRATL